ncbi:MAG: ATP-binding cassette domain-containing protein [Desulfomonilaceae bacterium]
MSFLELRDVSKNFSELVVLRGINLSVATGEKHAVIGPNGAGKTTLFNVISGKYRPSGGYRNVPGQGHHSLPSPQT